VNSHRHRKDYPTAIAQYAQAKISLGRVAVFLGYKELTGEGYIATENGTGEIVIEKRHSLLE
jgi:DNA-binding transcriptional regulator YhcF (GntR family)